MDAPIQLLDLAAQRARLGGRIEAAIARVVEHGVFIMGPEVAALEEELAEYCGAKHVVTCANGTDALVLVMMAENIGPGDAVFVPSFTFVATAEAVALRGATPVFVDVDPENFNICPKSLERAIAEAEDYGLRPRAVIAVDLFGLPADYASLRQLCSARHLLLVADAAQSFGGTYQSVRVGALADYTTTSFFPSKPLGCYGDGGAVMVDDAVKAELLSSLRFHGRGSEKYDNVRVGVNSRLDTIQAAVLREKLLILDEEIARRDEIAQAYSRGLPSWLSTPRVASHSRSAWAQYTITLPEGADRGQFSADLTSQGVPTAVYYPKPLHTQDGYRHFPVTSRGCASSESLATRVISLPMQPYLSLDQVQHVIDNVGADIETLIGRR